MLTDDVKIKIDNALSRWFQSVIINTAITTELTPAQKQQMLQDKELSQIQYKFSSDKMVIKLQEIFEAKFTHSTIKKIDKN